MVTARESTDQIWDIVEDIGVCMLTTRSARGLRARPLEARPDRAAGLIWFVTDVRGRKDDEIETHANVGLTFIDHAAKAYLSISARAFICNDHAKAAMIWKSTDDVWWTGPDDPNVRVLRVEPLVAELWDGPASSAVVAYEFLHARLTGKKPDLGENRKRVVRMR
jgi:general stress protein 26